MRYYRNITSKDDIKNAPFQNKSSKKSIKNVFVEYERGVCFTVICNAERRRTSKKQLINLYL